MSILPVTARKRFSFVLTLIWVEALDCDAMFTSDLTPQEAAAVHKDYSSCHEEMVCDKMMFFLQTGSASRGKRSDRGLSAASTIPNKTVPSASNTSFDGPLILNLDPIRATDQSLITEVVAGQARGMLAFVQSNERKSGGSEEAASTAGLLMVLVLVVALGLYALTTALKDDQKKQQRSNCLRSGILETAQSAPNVAPRSAANSLLQAWPPKTTSRTTPPPSHPLLASRTSAVRADSSPAPLEEAGESHDGIPAICPQLIMPTNYTRLAVPLDPLLDPDFEFDILGLSGMPLLSAAAVSRGGRRSIEISLHTVNTLLAVVTPQLQLTRADGSLIGSLARQTAAPSSYFPVPQDGSHHFVLRNGSGRNVLLISSGRTPQEMHMLAAPESTAVNMSRIVLEAAAITRQPAGQLPAEHYEVVVSANVDAVLVLACFLGLVTFILPPASMTPVAVARGLQSGYYLPAQVPTNSKNLACTFCV